MKKVLLLIILTFSCFVTFSQQTATFARAYLWSIGYRNEETQRVVWKDEPTSCDILLRFDETEVTIYSKTVQRFHIMSKVQDLDRASVYRAVDVNGVVCNYYIGNDENGILFVSIEYQDVSMVYFINIEE